MSYLLKNLLIALIITLVLGAGYYFTIGIKTDDFVLESEASMTVKQQTEKILLDTQKINEYTLDDSIFSDARFTSLTNTRIELDPVPTGRTNPFESIN